MSARIALGGPFLIGPLLAVPLLLAAALPAQVGGADGVGHRALAASLMSAAESARDQGDAEAAALATWAALGHLNAGPDDALRGPLIAAAQALGKEVDPRWAKRQVAIQRVAYRLRRAEAAYREVGWALLAERFAQQAAWVLAGAGQPDDVPVPGLLRHQEAAEALTGALRQARGEVSELAPEQISEHWWMAWQAIARVRSGVMRRRIAGEVAAGLDAADTFARGGRDALAKACDPLVALVEADLAAGLPRLALQTAQVACLADPVAGGRLLWRAQTDVDAGSGAVADAPAPAEPKRTDGILQRHFGPDANAANQGFRIMGDALENDPARHWSLIASGFTPPAERVLTLEVQSLERPGIQYAGLFFGTPEARGAFWAGLRIAPDGSLHAVAYRSEGPEGGPMVVALYEPVPAGSADAEIVVSVRLQDGAVQLRIGNSRWRKIPGSNLRYPAPLGLYVCGEHPAGPPGRVSFRSLRVE